MVAKGVALVLAIVVAGTHKAALGQIVHAAHPRVIQSRDVVRAAGAALGTSPIVVPMPRLVAAPLVWAIAHAAEAAGRRTAVRVDKLAEFFAPAWGLSCAKAERLLGWRAQYDLVEGMAQTAELYRKAGWLN